MVQIVVNSSLDVFGHNRRYVVVLEDTPVGTVIMVIIGAAAVGSIRFSARVAASVSKGAASPEACASPVCVASQTWDGRTAWQGLVRKG